VTEKLTDGRVYVSTYPTMMNLIDEVDDQGRRFGPGMGCAKRIHGALV